jgi:alkanesulfonate monooxygenase SsuD/methylene tetrahydromethanopterin reductase-like flavin-dependent oxidoreductase (luciferase family)
VNFCTFTLIDNSPDPITGIRLSTAERFQAVVRRAQWAEDLGFDGFGVGERHAYEALIDHYRQRWVDYGRDPADAVVAAGFNGLYVGKTSQHASKVYRPIFAAFMASPGAIHNKLPFRSLEDFLETGSVLVGSPEQIIDKFGRYQSAFGHELSGIATEVPGLPDDLNRESVERFVGDVIPVLRAAYPSRVWAS